MPISATVTAKSGPAVQATAVVVPNVSSFFVDIDKKVLQLFQGAPMAGPSARYELSGNTFTVTISSGAVTALTIS